MMIELAEFIRSQVDIPDCDLQTILSDFRELKVKKGKFLVKKGQLVSSYYFIRSGGLRIYFEKEDKQITAWLAFQNDFFTELESCRSARPTDFYIQAIEDTTLFSIAKTQMEKHYQQFPPWQQLGRQIWEEAFLKVTMRKAAKIDETSGRY